MGARGTISPHCTVPAYFACNHRNHTSTLIKQSPDFTTQRERYGPNSDKYDCKHVCMQIGALHLQLANESGSDAAADTIVVTRLILKESTRRDERRKGTNGTMAGTAAVLGPTLSLVPGSFQGNCLCFSSIIAQYVLVSRLVAKT